jgi:hypothetical protein
LRKNELYQILTTKSLIIKKCIVLPEYLRVISEFNIKVLKHTFMGKYSGCPPPPPGRKPVGAHIHKIK